MKHITTRKIRVGCVVLLSESADCWDSDSEEEATALLTWNRIRKWKWKQQIIFYEKYNTHNTRKNQTNGFVRIKLLCLSVPPLCTCQLKRDLFARECVCVGICVARAYLFTFYIIYSRVDDDDGYYFRAHARFIARNLLFRAEAPLTNPQFFQPNYCHKKHLSIHSLTCLLTSHQAYYYSNGRIGKLNRNHAMPIK